MKNYLLQSVLTIAMLGCISFTSNAQDIITLKKGRQIEAIVTEIKGDVIYYKYFSDPQGQGSFVYTDMVSNITYQNGTVKKFDDTEQPKLTEKPVSEEIINNEAQDVIVTKTGEEIKGKVLDIGLTEVKYKKYDNQNGPTYTLKKSDIFMIKYENGDKDVFNEIADQPQPTTDQKIIPYDRNIDSQQLPVMRYTFGKTISPDGPKKSPFLAGFLSFLVPGVGQFYNGDVGGGFIWMGLNIVCNSVWMSSFKMDSYGNVSTVDNTAFSIGLISALVVNIASIIDAAHGAKKVNIARGYRLGDTYLKIQPTIIKPNNSLTPTNKNYAYGMNISLDF